MPFSYTPYPLYQGSFEDDFPFPKVGYVGSLGFVQPKAPPATSAKKRRKGELCRMSSYRSGVWRGR